MKVFYCIPVTQPHLTGASPDIDDSLEMARSLLLQGYAVRLCGGDMDSAAFEEAQPFPLEALPYARFSIEATSATMLLLPQAP